MAISDADRNLYIRRLRFPRALEQRYQDRYFEQSLRFIRIGFIVVWCILAALTILVAFTETLSADNFVLLAYPLVSYGLSRHPSFRLYWKPYVAITMAAAVGYFFYVGSRSLHLSLDYPSDVTRIPLLALRTAIFYTIATGVMRLPFLWTTGWLFAMEMCFIIVVAQVERPAPTLLSSYIYLTLIFVVFPMLGSLALERYHRGDFLSNLLLEEERAKSEQLLLNVLPAPIAERLKTQPQAIADSFPEVSVLFADIVEFTPLAASMPAPEVVHLLNRVFSRFDELAEKHSLEKIKTIGDAYMVVGGLPEPRADHAPAIAEMALQMQAAIGEFQRPDGSPLVLRIGINSGPVVAGVIGTKRFLYDLWGDTVNMASRMESHGEPGMIQATEAAKTLLQGTYEFGSPLKTEVKGRGTMTTYRLLGRHQASRLEPIA